MKVIVCCPYCDDELEFDVTSDYQGDGPWGMVVDFVELVERKCDCEISDVSMNELENLAIDKVNDYDPANDFDFEYEDYLDGKTV